MKLPVLVLIALPLLAGAISAQEPPAEGGGAKEVPRANIRVRTDMERLFVSYGMLQGGRDQLKALKTVAFRWIPHEVTESGTRELAPLAVTLQLEKQGGERLVRVEEDVDGQHRTKLVNDLQNKVRVWVGEEERRVPELVAGAQVEAQLLFLLMDLLYRPESDELRSEFEGELDRDDREYLVAHYEFHPLRSLPSTYRVFYDGETGLIGRIDVHDKSTLTNARTSSFLLTEYAPVGDGKPQQCVKFPGRIEWQDRAGETRGLWRFVEVQLNPDLPPGHFQGP